MTTVFKSPNYVAVLNRLQAGPSIRLRGADFRDDFATTSSFRYDAPGEPLRSTQQVPLDWSQFENHTFFGSAEVNVNVAFDTIINNFPFDGTLGEVNAFIDSLTGFEKYVFDNFPKCLNSLRFKNNSYVSVKDVAGGTLPDLSRVKDGSSVLDPGAGSLSFQFKLLVPSESNSSSTVFQRLSGSSGYSLFLSSSSATSSSLQFYVTSGSSTISTSTFVNKGEWVDVCAQFNRKPSSNRLFLFLDGELAVSSSTSYEFLEFDTRGTELIIGSGSRHIGNGFDFTPTSTFSGALDEFRLYHKARSFADIKDASSTAATQSGDLRLYFKFNEPAGAHSQSSLVLDSSGNGLHSYVTNYTNALRSGVDGRASFTERDFASPVLFPDYPDLVTLNERLLTSASHYDDINPNLITKLVPKQYFAVGQISEGFETEEGPIVDSYPASGDLPRKSRLGAAQILSSLLYIWGKQFDENKIFIDHFSKLESMEYSPTGSIANTFLQMQARSYGFELPRLFTPTSLRTSDYGDDVGVDPSEGRSSLQDTQYQIWRRLIATLPDVIRSKGTLYAVKSVIRSFGVNPDTSIRVREYGGKRSGYVEGRRERRESTGKLAVTGSWVASSPFLSSSRVEPGAPLPAGNIGPLGSSNPSDGLLTSGSWSWEGVFRYPESRTVEDVESLVRFYLTGSTGENLALAVVATPVSNTDDGSAYAYLYGAYSSGSTNAFVIPLTGSTLFDGERWQVSLGRNRKSATRSEWFFRLGKSMSGDIAGLYEEVFAVTSSESSDMFSVIDSSYNASGSYFTVGSGSSVSSSSPFLGTGTYTVPLTGTFSGEVSNVRFYSKHLNGVEWREHIRNYESLGVIDPLKNFNFVTNESGSFERLRLDVPFDQEGITSDNLGRIRFFDYSQNELHLSGSGFEPSSTVITYDDVIFSSLEPKFDERSTDNKVRIRSWNSYENVLKYGGEVGPVYEIPRNEEPIDDTRFGIEVSVTKGLDDDIIKMFADYTAIDNAIGNPADQFEMDYPDLADLREVYFNRLTGKLDIRNVFLFSKWFEDNIGNLISQVLPANTRFFGTNFVVESHMLERHKSRYHWGDIYLGENDRRNLRGNIGLNQIIATVKRA